MSQTGVASATGDPAIDTLQDYVAALQMLRRVRTALMALLLLTLLIPPVVFASAETGQLKAWSPAVAEAAAPLVPMRVAEACLLLAALLAHGAALLLLVVYLLSVNVCLVGRLGSGREAMAAFFWMVLLLMMLGSWTPPVFGPQSPRAFFELDQLLDEAARVGEGWRESLVYYVRFLGLPLWALLAAVVADVRFGRTYVQAVRRLRERMGISVRV